MDKICAFAKSVQTSCLDGARKLLKRDRDSEQECRSSVKCESQNSTLPSEDNRLGTGKIQRVSSHSGCEEAANFQVSVGAGIIAASPSQLHSHCQGTTDSERFPKGAYHQRIQEDIDDPTSSQESREAQEASGVSHGKQHRRAPYRIFRAPKGEVFTLENASRKASTPQDPNSFKAKLPEALVQLALRAADLAQPAGSASLASWGSVLPSRDGPAGENEATSPLAGRKVSGLRGSSAQRDFASPAAVGAARSTSFGSWGRPEGRGQGSGAGQEELRSDAESPFKAAREGREGFPDREVAQRVGGVRERLGGGLAAGSGGGGIPAVGEIPKGPRTIFSTGQAPTLNLSMPAPISCTAEGSSLPLDGLTSPLESPPAGVSHGIDQRPAADSTASASTPPEPSPSGFTPLEPAAGLGGLAQGATLVNSFPCDGSGTGHGTGQGTAPLKPHPQNPQTLAEPHSHMSTPGTATPGTVSAPYGAGADGDLENASLASGAYTGPPPSAAPNGSARTGKELVSAPIAPRACAGLPLRAVPCGTAGTSTALENALSGQGEPSADPGGQNTAVGDHASHPTPAPGGVPRDPTPGTSSGLLEGARLSGYEQFLSTVLGSDNPAQGTSPGLSTLLPPASAPIQVAQSAGAGSSQFGVPSTQGAAGWGSHTAARAAPQGVPGRVSEGVPGRPFDAPPAPGPIGTAAVLSQGQIPASGFTGSDSNAAGAGFLSGNQNAGGAAFGRLGYMPTLRYMPGNAASSLLPLRRGAGSSGSGLCGSGPQTQAQPAIQLWDASQMFQAGAPWHAPQHQQQGSGSHRSSPSPIPGWGPPQGGPCPALHADGGMAGSSGNNFDVTSGNISSNISRNIFGEFFDSTEAGVEPLDDDQPPFGLPSAMDLDAV